jgi:hypothetical protein
MSLYNYFFAQTTQNVRIFPMSHPDISHSDSHHDEPDAQSHSEPNPADSKADAIAAFFIIAIAVSGILFFISQQYR